MNHTLARLLLLDRQADSLRAERELVRLNTLVAAGAAVWSKDGVKAVRDLESALREQI